MNKERQHFEGKSLTVIGDLSTDEQMHIYLKAKELKDATKSGRDDLVELFKIKQNAYGIETIFLEPSTRTKESFTHAAQFLDVKLNDFNVGQSSFSKKESYKDTIDMLTGYNNQIYVIRSKLEGVCKWLDHTGKKYAKRNDLPIPPAFINAGDGQHEHPTQELLDEFTFLEHNNRNTKDIHLAIIGDPKYGRTAHSKADGLKIFENVKIDLVAPDELAMPKEYEDKMRDNGYQISSYSSISEYFSNPERIAPILYVTRPQLERMDESTLKIQNELRKAITFDKEHYEILKKIDPDLKHFKIYHPLPRNSEHPELPGWLDETPLNGWEGQAINGYYVRAAYMAAVAGNKHVNHGFTGKTNPEVQYEDDFIEEISLDGKISQEKVSSEGFNPLENGIVIDHIGKGKDAKEIRKIIDKVSTIFGDVLGGKSGTYVYEQGEKRKGIMFWPGVKELDKETIRKLASLLPGSTINIIKDKHIIRKMRIKLPLKMESAYPEEGLPEIHCKNGNCISHPGHNEKVPPEFIRKGEESYKCGFCEKDHHHDTIWNIAKEKN